MNNQERFMMLYGNNKQTATCNGSELLGSSYVCPQPTIGGKGPSPFSKPNPKCGVEVPNMGILAYCCQKQDKIRVSSEDAEEEEQTGGAPNMMFTATGKLEKKRCMKNNGRARHRAMLKLSNKNLYPPNFNSTKYNDRSNPGHPAHSGDPSVLDFPRDQCDCRSSSHCGYVNGNGTPLNGYFINPSGSVGNRPLHGSHDNIHINSPDSWNDNLLERKFDCQQPFWCERCL